MYTFTAFIIHIVGVNLPSIMPVSSWVGVELGYISDSYTALHLDHDHGPFSVFLRTIPYR
jgi:Na+/H+ antiporter NhaC